jgi:hypothetical protein
MLRIEVSLTFLLPVAGVKYRAGDRKGLVDPREVLGLDWPRSVTQELSAMDLELESGTVVRQVAEKDLADHIEREDFAILSEDKQAYIQCAKQSPGSGYVLEYQDGSVERHYTATGGPIAMDRVVSAFIKYLRRDPSWRSDFQWERVEI